MCNSGHYVLPLYMTTSAVIIQEYDSTNMIPIAYALFFTLQYLDSHMLYHVQGTP